MTELFDDFQATLEARERARKHVEHVVGRTRELFAACGFATWSDLDAFRLEQHLHSLRAQGLSARSSNHRLAAAKQFTRWALSCGLAGEDPFATLSPLNARTDPKRERRALSWDDELPRLIRAAAEGPEHRGVSGTLRALVYRLAAHTGFRVSELASLRVGDFDLDPERPTVTLQARAAKNRREARLPLRPETARDLAPFVRSKLPSAPALPLPKSFKDKATRWLRFDLERAGIPYQDDAGRFADFHSFRAAFVTGLMRSGASPKVVQALARHASAEMTLGIYSKLGRDEDRRALAMLPDILPKRSGAEAATGTDAESVGSSVGFRVASPCSSVRRDATRNPTQAPENAPHEAANGGGGGNRTRVTARAHPPKTGPPDTEKRDSAPPTTEGENVLGVLLGVSDPPDPDLDRLLAAWPRLSAGVRRSLADLASGSTATEDRA